MKKYITVLLLVFIVNLANAQITTMPFEIGIFDIDVLHYSKLIKIDNNESGVIDTHYNFTNKEKTYEVRYSLFKQTTKNFENIREVFYKENHGVVARSILLNDINLFLQFGEVYYSFKFKK